MALAGLLKNYRSNIEPRVAFWERPYLWPDDSPDHIFSARAVLALGVARNGAAWSDDIPAEPRLDELSSDYSLHIPIEEIRRATAILTRIPSTYNEKPGGRASTLLTEGWEFPTTDEWAQAVAEAKARSDGFWARYILFLRTVLELARACKAGALMSATRPHYGGEPILQPWHFWNLERGERRFDTCRVDPNDYFVSAPFTEPGHWLFFERNSFENYKTSQGESAPKVQPATEEIAAAKRSRPRGRPRGDQIDVIAGKFAQMVKSGEITAESTGRNIARQLADWAATVFEDPHDEGYIRERSTF